MSKESSLKHQRKFRKAYNAAFSVVLCVCLAASVLISPRGIQAAAAKVSSKADMTPAFWQKDPAADFEDEGRMHCAPTAVSDGLIYLAKAYGMKGLVPGTKKKAQQIALIEELADHFKTDPGVGGTNPDKILTGLRTYVKSRGYGLERLEMMGWRGVGNGNRKFKIGAKPDLAWIRDAVRSENTVVIFNFGWYYKNRDGYIRNGGHWVAVVGAGAKSNEFSIHNPALPTDRQLKNREIVLTRLDRDFMAQTSGAEGEFANMKGQYDGNGPGLARGNKVSAALLDAVIVFSVGE